MLYNVFNIYLLLDYVIYYNGPGFYIEHQVPTISTVTKIKINILKIQSDLAVVDIVTDDWLIDGYRHDDCHSC